MSPKGTKGKRSTWQKADRCLDIVVQLMSGPKSSAELLSIVEDQTQDDGGIVDPQRVFEEDRKQIRNWLCDISHDYPSTYELGDFRRPLFNLPDEAVRGLAFLQKTFGSPHAPMREEVQSLIESIRRVLPSGRRRDIQNARGLMELELKAKDKDIVDEETELAVQQACVSTQLINIRYQANRPDKAIVEHRVEPLRYFFDSVRGHRYLEAFCLETRGPGGLVNQNNVKHYRLGRILEIAPLPSHFVRGRRIIPTYELIYRLSPEIARNEITEHFPKSHITRYDDGSAEVRTHSISLFFDLRTLLHYGPHCQVIGGEEAVKDMRTLVQKMYKEYFPSTE